MQRSVLIGMILIKFLEKKNLKDFLSDPYGIIEECLETRLELSQMECNGHLQAIDKIYELYNSTKVLFP